MSLAGPHHLLVNAHLPAACEPSVETHMPDHSHLKLQSCHGPKGGRGYAGLLGVVSVTSELSGRLLPSAANCSGFHYLRKQNFRMET